MTVTPGVEEPDPIILRIRQLGDLGSEMSDDEIRVILVNEDDDVTGAIAAVWEWKAARYSKMMDISEGGSSRSMGDMYKNALDLAKYWRRKQTEENVPPPVVPGYRPTIVRKIERT